MDPNGTFWRPYGVGAGAYPHLGNIDLGPDDLSQPIPPVHQQESLANEVDDFLDEFLHLTGDVGDDSLHGAGVGLNTGGVIDLHDGLDLESLWKSDAALPRSVVGTDELVVDVGDDDNDGRRAADEKREESEEEEAEETLSPHADVEAVGGGEADCTALANPPDAHGQLSEQEQLRRQKVARYLEKKKRRQWYRDAPYKNRQRVANSRPRHKGRFLPLESEFVPIAELQRRQRVSFKFNQDQQVPGTGMTNGEVVDDG